VPVWVSQRLIAMALGYEDLNDHNPLRHDPLRAVACKKHDPLGANRSSAADRGKALASAPTLNRLERGGEHEDRYHKITQDPHSIEQCLLTMGVRCLPKHVSVVIVHATVRGNQGRALNSVVSARVLTTLSAELSIHRSTRQLRPFLKFIRRAFRLYDD